MAIFESIGTHYKFCRKLKLNSEPLIAQKLEFKLILLHPKQNVLFWGISIVYQSQARKNEKSTLGRIPM